MNMSGVNEIRSTFLNYFAANGHEIVPSSPLVPRNDPPLMFTNAGMVQFKNVFTGVEKRAYQRATTSQKCVRAGGKHNDLDNVGYSARHHTFFEMLGNFSFGDYFKDRAIELAWNLVTKEFGLSKDKLTATVYVDDDEAFDLWKKIAGLPESRIIRIAGSDNFWQMGDTGPCGPCSEIFYDHGDKIPGGPPGSPDEDGDRFIEIWNLVFMQFDQQQDGTRLKLPKPSTDPGMGLMAMPPDLDAAFRKFIPPFGAAGNPVDITGGEPPITYVNTVKLGLEDPRIHALILGYWHTIVTPPMVFAKNMVEVKNAMKAKGIEKPIVASLAGDIEVEEAADYLYQNGIVAYAYSTEIPVAVLGAKYKWARGAGLL